MTAIRDASSICITTDIYSHVLPALAPQAIEGLEQLLSGTGCREARR